MEIKRVFLELAKPRTWLTPLTRYPQPGIAGSSESKIEPEFSFPQSGEIHEINAPEADISAPINTQEINPIA